MELGWERLYKDRDNWKTLKNASPHIHSLCGISLWVGCWSEGGCVWEIDGGREWEAWTVAREDRERWSEYGVGSLNSEREECRVIKEKEEVQEGNKRLEENNCLRKKRLVLHLKSYSMHSEEYIWMKYIDGGRSGWLKCPYFMGTLFSLFSDWLLSPHISHCYWWPGMFVVCHWADSRVG